MGTNFYRIPTEKEMEERKNRLQTRVRQIDLSPTSINQGFSISGPDRWDGWSPWDEFTDELLIHLGKRSMGWKFLWNFNDNKFYTNKEELFNFIKRGRIINEYGEELTPDEFIEMSTTWCVDGYDTQTYYEENPPNGRSWFNVENYHDIYIDELRVSNTTDFS